MKNRKIFATFLILPLLLVSCGEQKFKVSMFFYNEDDTFIGALAKNLEGKLGEGGYDFKTYFAKSSQNIQNEQIITEINNKTNILVVNTVDRLSSSAIIDKASSVNLPVVLLNREPLKEDLAEQEKVYYVGSDPKNEGRIQADLISNLFIDNAKFTESSYDKNKDGVIQTVIIKGEQGHQDTEQRSIYCISQMEALGFKIEVVDSMFADWNRESSYSLFKNVYANNPNIELIFSNNDDMALGAIDYLKSLKNYDVSKSITEQYFPIVGVDATTVGLESVANEEMYGTVKNDGNKQTEVITHLIDFILNNKDMASFPFEFSDYHAIHIIGEGITKDNTK